MAHSWLFSYKASKAVPVLLGESLGDWDNRVGIQASIGAHFWPSQECVLLEGRVAEGKISFEPVV